MITYHKIQSLFKRDASKKGNPLMLGEYSTPELEYLKDNLWEYTEKLDGTNIRVEKGDTTLNYGGKTDEAQIPAKLVARLRERFDDKFATLHEMFPEGVCLYGEGCGPGIQKGGGNYGAFQDFILFDVKVGPWWLRRKDVEDVATKLDIQFAPVVGEGTLLDLVKFVRKGFQSKWGPFEAEGVVARPKIEMFDRAGRRIITKLKAKDFETAVDYAFCKWHRSGWYPKDSDFRNMLGWVRVENGNMSITSSRAGGYHQQITEKELVAEWTRITPEQYLEIFGLLPTGNECEPATKP